MGGRHKSACTKAAGCRCGCWCHAGTRPGPRGTTAPDPAIGVKASVVRLRRALEAVKAYMATLKTEIEATAEELEGMIGSNE